MEISLFLLRRLLGVKTEDKKQTKVGKLVKGELLLINIGSTSTGGRVLSVKADLAKIQLTSPACTEIGEKVALSRRIEKHWRLVGKHLRLFLFIFIFVAELTAVCYRMGKCATWDCIRGRLAYAYLESTEHPHSCLRCYLNGPSRLCDHQAIKRMLRRYCMVTWT